MSGISLLVGPESRPLWQKLEMGGYSGLINAVTTSLPADWRPRRRQKLLNFRPVMSHHLPMMRRLQLLIRHQPRWSKMMTQMMGR